MSSTIFYAICLLSAAASGTVTWMIGRTLGRSQIVIVGILRLGGRFGKRTAMALYSLLGLAAPAVLALVYRGGGFSEPHLVYPALALIFFPLAVALLFLGGVERPVDRGFDR